LIGSSSGKRARGETIVEIGAGRGALTKHLVEGDCRLVAVEFDRELIESLREEMSARANFTLIESDALTLDFCAAIEPARKARVVANLPYNISTAILQRLIEQRRCITEMILMLQREVVERIMAPPGSSERGYLRNGGSLLRSRKAVRCCADGVSSRAEGLEHSRAFEHAHGCAA
jgi:16S rRNA (adenine1518-N6/adenine1519-N6)-dimethyltransferase